MKYVEQIKKILILLT